MRLKSKGYTFFVSSSKDNLTSEDKKLVETISNNFNRLYNYNESSLELISELSSEILKAGDMVNAYFASNEPWVLAKDETKFERYQAVIYTTLDALRLIANAMYPFMPTISTKILSSLGINEKPTSKFAPFELTPNNQTVVGDPLFPFIG